MDTINDLLMNEEDMQKRLNLLLAYKYGCVDATE
jgi:hypothetical protein